MMVEQELSENVDLKNENWDRLLPTFKKMKRRKILGRKGLSVNQIKKMQKKTRKTKWKKYTQWPPEPTPSKIDLAMESGEYWNAQWKRENLKRRSHEEKLAEWREEQRQRREKRKKKARMAQQTAKRIKKQMQYIAPQEDGANDVREKLKRNKVEETGAKFPVSKGFRFNVRRRTYKKKPARDVDEFLL